MQKSQNDMPMVVISCLAYNHEPYIRDALDGFVMQQTNFPFVAIVHDDASTDGTAAIIREYAEKYPDIIKPIYETENQYSKRDGSLGCIMREARGKTGAKYVALCEGDDYWTDPLKLQKQVDFLESHPEYSMCFHNATVHYEHKNIPDHVFAELETREYDVLECVENWIVPTASILYRITVLNSECTNKLNSSRKIIVSDNKLIRCCGEAGKLYAYKEAMSVYRKSPSGWTSKVNNKLILPLIKQDIEYTRILGPKYKKLSQKSVGTHSRAALSMFRHGDIITGSKVIAYSLWFAPWDTIKANIKFLSKCFKSASHA